MTIKRKSPEQTWTVAQMIALRPCAHYDRDRVTALWAGLDRLTLREIAGLEIPPTDRMWAIWRGLTATQTRAVLERIVTRVVTAHAVDCGVAGVEAWAARWLDG